MKYIKNPPTIEDLELLFNSETYKTLLIEFLKETKLKYSNGTDDRTALWNLLAHTQKRYLQLNIPIEEICLDFENNGKELIKFAILQSNFFADKEDEDSDGEFPEGEEPAIDEKSKVIETSGLSKTFLLDRFCEFYLLKQNDKERLANFLKLTRMPFAKKYQGQLSKIYKQMTKLN